MEAKDVFETAPSAAPADVAAAQADAYASAPSAIDLVVRSLEDSKGEDIVAIDMRGKSPLADHMVVVSGRSHRHVTAVAERLLADLKDNGFGSAKVEGLQNGDWVLIDTGDIIIHIFRPEIRAFYNLEKMWTAGNAAADATKH